jgi:hypothetical protein
MELLIALDDTPTNEENFGVSNLESLGFPLRH